MAKEQVKTIHYGTDILTACGKKKLRCSMNLAEVTCKSCKQAEKYGATQGQDIKAELESQQVTVEQKTGGKIEITWNDLSIVLFDLWKRGIPYFFSHSYNGEVSVYMDFTHYNKVRDLYPHIFTNPKVRGDKTTYFKIIEPKLDAPEGFLDGIEDF